MVPRNVIDAELAYRPHAIGLSADGTLSMFRVRWLTYGGPVAHARARAYVRGCQPDCARGQVTHPKADLHLSNLIPCHGTRAYSRLRFVLHSRLPGGDRRHGSLLILTREGCRQ